MSIEVDNNRTFNKCNCVQKHFTSNIISNFLNMKCQLITGKDIINVIHEYFYEIYNILLKLVYKFRYKMEVSGRKEWDNSTNT